MRQSRKYTSEPFDGRLSIFDGSSVRNSPLMVRSSCTILLTLSPGGMAPLSANGTTDTGMAEFAPSVIRISSSALALPADSIIRSEEHTSELQSRPHLVCRILLEKKNRPQDLLF